MRLTVFFRMQMSLKENSEPQLYVTWRKPSVMLKLFPQERFFARVLFCCLNARKFVHVQCSYLVLVNHNFLRPRLVQLSNQSSHPKCKIHGLFPEKLIFLFEKQSIGCVVELNFLWWTWYSLRTLHLLFSCVNSFWSTFRFLESGWTPPNCDCPRVLIIRPKQLMSLLIKDLWLATKCSTSVPCRRG